jgi:hypothetical protein
MDDDPFHIREWKAFFNHFTGQSITLISHQPLVSEAMAQSILLTCLPRLRDHDDSDPPLLREVDLFSCRSPCRITPDFYHIYINLDVGRPRDTVARYRLAKNNADDWQLIKSFETHCTYPSCRGCPICPPYS